MAVLDIPPVADNFLNTNPFYVLNVSHTDTQKVIEEAAQKPAVLHSEEKRTKAQTALVDPAFRPLAEVFWFIDCDSSAIADIRKSIARGVTIPSVEALPPFSKLNAALYNFILSPKVHFFKLGQQITDIDSLFRAVDTVALRNLINQGRAQAQMRAATEQEIQSALEKKQSQIADLIKKRLSSLDEEKRSAIFSVLSKRLAELPNTGANGILPALVGQQKPAPKKESAPPATTPQKPAPATTPAPKKEEPSPKPANPPASTNSNPPQEPVTAAGSDNFNKVAKKWLVFALICLALFASNIAFISRANTAEKELATNKERVATLRKENASLEKALADMEATTKPAVDTFEAIDRFITSGKADEYNAHKLFYTTSNVFIVKKGSSTEFDVTYKNYGEISFDCSNSNVKAEFGKVQYNVWPVTVTGKETGSTVVTFSNNRNDETFRVLIIVV